MKKSNLLKKNNNGYRSIIKYFCLILIIFSFTNINFCKAQTCDPNSTLPVTFTSVSTTNEICPQNGTITVNGIAGGGGVYAYEIFSGPIVRAIQSQNVFAALSAGT